MMTPDGREDRGPASRAPRIGRRRRPARPAGRATPSAPRRSAGRARGPRSGARAAARARRAQTAEAIEQLEAPSPKRDAARPRPARRVTRRTASSSRPARLKELEQAVVGRGRAPVTTPPPSLPRIAEATNARLAAAERQIEELRGERDGVMKAGAGGARRASGADPRARATRRPRSRWRSPPRATMSIGRLHRSLGGLATASCARRIASRLRRDRTEGALLTAPPANRRARAGDGCAPPPAIPARRRALGSPARRGQHRAPTAIRRSSQRRRASTSRRRSATALASYSGLDAWPPVSIVVLNRNGPRPSRAAGDGAARAHRLPRAELIVVDNASSDDSRRVALDVRSRDAAPGAGERTTNRLVLGGEQPGRRSAPTTTSCSSSTTTSSRSRAGWLRELVASHVRRRRSR